MYNIPYNKDYILLYYSNGDIKKLYLRKSDEGSMNGIQEISEKL